MTPFSVPHHITNIPGGGLAISADGSLVAGADHSSTISIWESDTGRLVHVLDGHMGFVDCLSFSPNGKWLATGGRDGTLRLWDVKTGRTTHTLTIDDKEIVWATFSKGGEEITAASLGGSAVVWTVESAKEVKRVVIDPDGITLATASPDWKTLAFIELKGSTGSNRLALWDLHKSRLIGDFPEIHKDAIISLAFTPEGGFVASGSDDKTIAIWRIEDRTLVKKIVGHDGWVSAVTFDKGGNTIVTGSWDKSVRVWDRQSGAQLRRIDGSKTINSIALSADGKVLAVGYHESAPTLYEFNTGKEIRKLRLRVRQEK